MWKVFAILASIGTIFGCAAIENPKEEANKIVEYVIQGYEFSKDKLEGNSTQVIWSIATTVLWITVYLLMVRVSNIGNTIDKKPVIANAYTVETNPVTDRAKARTLYYQLRQDLMIIEGRQKYMPEEIDKAREDLLKAKELERITERQLENAVDERVKAEGKLDDLQYISDKNNSEIKSLNNEIYKLKDLI